MEFLCYQKCTTCQKARKWLDDRGVQYKVREINIDNPTYDELKKWLSASGFQVKKLFNTSGLLYKSMNLKDRLADMSEDECLKLLATNGMLVKRPILAGKGIVLIGFKEAEWESAISIL